ncbi:MAG: N-acetylornithine carbamoyltransferase [Planctomycetes bacterium]|nr:N-acetylornithine carbamoyltransferase [Planctomycetota bacterium]
MTITGRDLITIDYYKPEELEWLFNLAWLLKNEPDLRKRQDMLDGFTLAMVFFNPSLRTRTSLDIGMYELGGHTITLNIGAGVWDLEVEEGIPMLGDKVEHIKDAAKVLGRYSDAIGIRSFPKMNSWAEDKKDLAIISFQKYSDVPIINLETALYHPCQALADAYTIREKFGAIKNRKVLLTWTTHPKALPMAVPNSFSLMSSKLGMDLTICRPDGWDLDDEIMARVRRNAKAAGSTVTITNDFEGAFEGQEVVYAKSWGSKNYYGRTPEELMARQPYHNWTVGKEQMARTANGKFMHCLPVRRNVVATDEVLDSESSIIYDQAENRLHTQKAVLLGMLGSPEIHAKLAERFHKVTHGPEGLGVSAK